MTDLSCYQNFCEERHEQNRLRRLQDSTIRPEGRVGRAGQTFVNLSSNDYLGLSQHPALIETACAFARDYGAGTTASRLITGNHPAYAVLENTLAAGKGKEAALIMGTGYQANLTVLAALADKAVTGREVTVIADRLAHHSLLQGAVLSGARLMRFQHNDDDHLESILKTETGKNRFCLIVSESVFGMDGDGADLPTLTALSQRYRALLYIDEAHATGVFGKNGFGRVADCPDGVDLAMGTFGKALGSFGAYVACAASLRDYLLQRCGGLIYSTALPPATLGSIKAALQLLPHMGAERDYLRRLSDHLRAALTAQGWDCGRSTTHIIPVIVGAEKTALAIADQLKEKGFLVPAIRPPTVPPQGSRLRLSLSAAHTRADIDRFIAVMGELAPHYIGIDAA